MSDLLGKRALVCGGSQGIGRACAEALAWHGATVVLLARDAARLQAARAGLPCHPDTAAEHECLTADFGDPPGVRAVVDAFLAARGPVHVLVNNTGGPPGGPLVEAAPEQFTHAFASHLLCNHLLSQAVIPGMRDAGYGRIINVVSTSVRRPIKGLGVSNTVRGAVASWAKTLSEEVARLGITVNNVLPGATRTARLESVVAARARASGRGREAIEAEPLSEIP